MTFEQDELYREAQTFVRGKVIEEIFARLERRTIEDWKRSDPASTQNRDDAYHLMRAISGLRTELTALAAEPTIDQFNRRLKSV